MCKFLLNSFGCGHEQRTHAILSCPKDRQCKSEIWKDLSVPVARIPGSSFAVNYIPGGVCSLDCALTIVNNAVEEEESMHSIIEDVDDVLNDWRIPPEQARQAVAHARSQGRDHHDSPDKACSTAACQEQVARGSEKKPGSFCAKYTCATTDFQCLREAYNHKCPAASPVYPLPHTCFIDRCGDKVYGRCQDACDHGSLKSFRDRIRDNEHFL